MDELWAWSGFDWDDGNSEKNWLTHGVRRSECEEVFFNRPLVVPQVHPLEEREARYHALGETGAGRRLFVVFTVRGNLVRVISARDMSRRERSVYERGDE